MSRANPDAPTYDILMAVRDSRKPDTLFGQEKGKAVSRKHAHVSSRNRQAAERGLKKLEGMK